MNGYRSLALAAVATIALGGCAKKAEGQVAAVVNGEEVTLQEINAEIAQRNLPDSADKNAVRQAALQSIIQRRVLAQAARNDGLDRDAEYLLKRRALDDALLIQMMARKIDSTIRIPDDQQLEAAMQQRSSMFANRSVLSIDRIQFPPPADRSKLELLKDDHSLAAVEATLHAQNIAFTRSAGKLDTARMAPELVSQIDAVPAGEPFIIEQGGVVNVSVVTGRETVPMDAAAAKPMASKMLRAESLSKAIDQRLKTAMSEAKIEYQTGFAPPKQPKQPSAK